MAKLRSNSANGTVAKGERGDPQPTWLFSLNSYPEKQRLVFHDDKELERAVDLLWTDELRHMPHSSPDGKSLVVPAEAVAYFQQAGLAFVSKALRNVSDLPANKITRIRQ